MHILQNRKRVDRCEVFWSGKGVGRNVVVTISLENLERKITLELDLTHLPSRELFIGFPSSKRRVVSISYFIHSKHVLSPLVQSIDHERVFWNRIVLFCRGHNPCYIGYKVPAMRMILVQHSTYDVARRASLDSFRQGVDEQHPGSQISSQNQRECPALYSNDFVWGGSNAI